MQKAEKRIFCTINDLNDNAPIFQGTPYRVNITEVRKQVFVSWSELVYECKHGCKRAKHCRLIANGRSQTNRIFRPCVRNMNCMLLRSLPSNYYYSQHSITYHIWLLSMTNCLCLLCRTRPSIRKFSQQKRPTPIIGTMATGRWLMGSPEATRCVVTLGSIFKAVFVPFAPSYVGPLFSGRQIRHKWRDWRHHSCKNAGLWDDQSLRAEHHSYGKKPLNLRNAGQ